MLILKIVYKNKINSGWVRVALSSILFYKMVKLNCSSNPQTTSAAQLVDGAWTANLETNSFCQKTNTQTTPPPSQKQWFSLELQREISPVSLTSFLYLKLVIGTSIIALSTPYCHRELSFKNNSFSHKLLELRGRLMCFLFVLFLTPNGRSLTGVCLNW